MSGTTASQEMTNGNKGALGDITNVHGKRGSLLDFTINLAGNKIGKYQYGPKEGFKTRKGLFDDGNENGDMLHSSGGDEANAIFSFNTNCFDESMMLNFKGGAGWKNRFLDIMSLHATYNSATDSRKLESLGHVGFFSSSVPEDSGENCSDDEETDSEDSARYPFQFRKDHDTATIPTRTGLNFPLIKESSAISAESCHNSTLTESAFLGYLRPSELSDISASGMGNLLNGTSNCCATDKECCKCSFCLKAAYMLTDLYYQDARGRLSALKRSKRLARYLQGRIFCDNSTTKTSRDNSTRSNELGFELTQSWRSLFFHSENVLAQETAQLQHGTLLMLKELKENSKKDLENISITPSSKWCLFPTL